MADLHKAENQFQQMITECRNDPVRPVPTINDKILSTPQKILQAAYETHRTNRNASFRDQIHQPGFHQWKKDKILHQVLEAESGLTDYVDPRNNLAYWARPPRHVRDLVYKIQQEIGALIGSCMNHCFYILIQKEKCTDRYSSSLASPIRQSAHDDIGDQF
jgi:hypothetical protein